MSGYRGNYSDIRMDESTQSTPTSGLYDIVVTTCSANEYRTGRTLLKTLAQVVEDSLKSSGVGIFVTPAGMLQDRFDSEGREYLLEKHKLSSCIELRFSDYSSTPYTDALWVIDQNDGPDTPNGNIFLASLGGDGLTNINPDFYENLNGTPEQCVESLKWFTDLVAEQKCLPFLSAKIPVKRILERRDVSLRFSTYESTIDMGSRVQEVANLQTAWSHYQEVIGLMGQANDSFYKALNAIVQKRSEEDTTTK